MRLNLLACVALFLVAGTVAAQDVDALQLRNRRLQEEIAALEKESSLLQGPSGDNLHNTAWDRVF